LPLVNLERTIEIVDSSSYQGDADAETIRNQLELIAGYLLPLNLIGSQYPIEEHARVAAETIRSNQLAKL